MTMIKKAVYKMATILQNPAACPKVLAFWYAPWLFWLTACVEHKETDAWTYTQDNQLPNGNSDTIPDPCM